MFLVINKDNIVNMDNVITLKKTEYSSGDESFYTLEALTNLASVELARDDADVIEKMFQDIMDAWLDPKITAFVIE